MTYTATLAAAAVKVAASFGIPGADPVILADGANVIVHLRPAPVVAKAAVSTTAVRPDPAAWLQRELRLSRWTGPLGLKGHERCPGSDQQREDDPADHLQA